MSGCSIPREVTCWSDWMIKDSHIFIIVDAWYSSASGRILNTLPSTEKSFYIYTCIIFTYVYHFWKGIKKAVNRVEVVSQFISLISHTNEVKINLHNIHEITSAKYFI